MAVGAQQNQVLKTVIATIAVDVVKLRAFACGNKPLAFEMPNSRAICAWDRPLAINFAIAARVVSADL